MSVKISSLELENVKRIKAVTLEPTQNGLTVIGGKNRQGKTSVLDSIAWALGGDRLRPTSAERDDSVTPPSLHIVLSNGIVVDRRGKNGDLRVLDPSGNKAGQQLLNEFISAFALDLPKFLQSTPKEKAQILLQIIGVGDKLFALERQESDYFNRRTMIGQIRDQKKNHAAEMQTYPGVPDELISASDLIKQQQEVLARNGANQEFRRNLASLKTQATTIDARIETLKEELYQLEERRACLSESIIAGEKTASELNDESTEELERNISNVDAINVKVRANMEKCRAEDEATQYSEQYNDLTNKINDVRSEKMELLNGAELPLVGLSVENSELTYNGKAWDCMSGSDQLKVAAAIVRKLNPECGFVLLDKLEQMDVDTLREFGEWLESEGLQAIATRVSVGEECSVIIEDGYSVEKVQEEVKKTWEKGRF